jgi:hypothetical protein
MNNNLLIPQPWPMNRCFWCDRTRPESKLTRAALIGCDKEGLPTGENYVIATCDACLVKHVDPSVGLHKG